MKKLYSLIILFLLLNSILVFTNACKSKNIKSDIKVASESFATEDITKNDLKLEDIREVPIEATSKKKEPSFFLFLFNRKEYQKQKDLLKVVKTKKESEITKTIKEEETNKVIEKQKIDILTKNNISSKSFIKKEIEDNYEIIEQENKQKENNIEELIINDDIKSEMSNNKNIEYIEKVFKNQADKLNIRTLIKDANNKEYEKIYNDIVNGKYKNTINEFINNHEGIFNDFKIEFSKQKYKNFNNSIGKKWEDHKYDKLKQELKKIGKKYEKETEEIKTNFIKLNLKTLLLNLNDGKYKNLINEVKEHILKDEYIDLREEFLNEIVDGEYTDTVYDLIYNFFDITYKYKINEINNNEKLEETNKNTNIIEEEKEEVNEKKISIIPIFSGILVLIIALIAFLILIKRKGENNNE